MKFKSYKQLVYVAGIVGLLIGSCSSSTDPYKQYTGKENIYLQNVDSVIAYSGKTQVNLKLVKPIDPLVTGVGIFWHAGNDSLKPKFSSDSDTLEVNINNLEKGTYTFNIHTYDNKGNKSKNKSKTVRVLGKNFVNGLRPSGKGTENDPFLITSLDNLKWVDRHPESWSDTFKQTSDIDATDTKNWNGGKGFAPIGKAAAAFIGMYNGGGHEIQGLYIDRAQSNQIGMFGKIGNDNDGSISKGTIKNLKLTQNIYVVGNEKTGGLVGELWGTVKNVQISGNQESIISGGNSTGGLVGGDYGYSLVKESNVSIDVKGGAFTGGVIGTSKSMAEVSDCQYNGGTVMPGKDSGGLVGYLNHGKIVNGKVSGEKITGSNTTGGLVGLITSGTVESSQASIDVDAGKTTGGLVGYNNKSSTVKGSHATGNVTGTKRVGGLVGLSRGDLVTDSYATGDVNSNGHEKVGGLVGATTNDIKESYATGKVKGGDMSGGLVGYVDGALVEHCYSIGEVTGGNVGGLIGKAENGATTMQSYWNTDTSKLNSSAGGKGLSTSKMQGSDAKNNMKGFDFIKVWQVQTSPDNYPMLRNNPR